MAEVISLSSVGAHMSGELGPADAHGLCCLLAHRSDGPSPGTLAHSVCRATLQQCTGTTQSGLLHVAADWQVAAHLVTCWCSPHILSITERIQCNCQPISQTDLDSAAEQLGAALSSVPGVTHFEALTALAMAHFQDQQVCFCWSELSTPRDCPDLPSDSTSSVQLNSLKLLNVLLQITWCLSCFCALMHCAAVPQCLLCSLDCVLAAAGGCWCH